MAGRENESSTHFDRESLLSVSRTKNRNEFQNLSQDKLPGEVNDVLTIMDPGEENSELLVLQICSISLLVGDRLQLCMILKILTCRMTNID